jgi:hypothetical protein
MVVDGEGVLSFDQNRHHPTHKTQDHTDHGSESESATSSRSQTPSKNEPVQPSTEMYPIKIGSFCTTNASVDATLHDLHVRLKHGERAMQLTIDTYLIACACEHSLPWDILQNIRPSEMDVPQYHTLPDITRFIPCSFTSDPVTGIISYYIQLLSPLKRKSRIRRGNPTPPTCHVEASVCLNLIQATLLGLYPRASKKPIWRTRVAIAGCIYKLHTASFDKKCQFLKASHEILRLCFTEYIINMRADFCQVENQFLTKHANFLPNYDAACITLCDHVRQSCVQSTDWSWQHINNVCSSSLDRVSRMCRTQLISVNTHAKLETVKPHHIHTALDTHIEYSDSQAQVYAFTSTTEMIHQTVQIHALPWNLVKTQATRIVDKFAELLFPVLAACEKHICIRCAHGTNTRLLQRVSKLRMNTKTMQLSCANCKSDDTVVKINVFGKILSIRNVKYFSCQECTALHIYNPESPLTCTRYDIPAMIPLLDLNTRSNTSSLLATTVKEDTNLSKIDCKPHPHMDRKNRCKWCGRICSARTLQLLHTASASTVSVTLCFKHFPALFMLKMIIDTESFVRYTIDVANNAIQNASKSKSKRLSQ